MKVLHAMEKKTFLRPDELRKFEKGKVDLCTIAGVTFGRATLEPGWRWSTSIKPIAKTDSCEGAHLQYHVSGRLHVVMDDGSEEEFVTGDISNIPPGHEAWVVGNEPVVVIDVQGLGDYAKR